MAEIDVHPRPADLLRPVPLSAKGPEICSISNVRPSRKRAVGIFRLELREGGTCVNTRGHSVKRL